MTARSQKTPPAVAGSDEGSKSLDAMQYVEREEACLGRLASESRLPRAGHDPGAPAGRPTWRGPSTTALSMISLPLTTEGKTLGALKIR